MSSIEYLWRKIVFSKHHTMLKYVFEMTHYELREEHEARNNTRLVGVRMRSRGSEILVLSRISTMLSFDYAHMSQYRKVKDRVAGHHCHMARWIHVSMYTEARVTLRNTERLCRNSMAQCRVEVDHSPGRDKARAAEPRTQPQCRCLLPAFCILHPSLSSSSRRSTFRKTNHDDRHRQLQLTHY